MSKKTFLQIFLFSIVFFIFFSVFKLYFDNKDKIVKNDKIITSDEPTKETFGLSSSNKIQNIKYLSKDAQGNQYEVSSEFGEIDLNNPNIIFMTNVIAKIKSENYSTIIIRADFAKYNSTNYETNFTGNTSLTHENSKIISDNLDLSLKSNLVTFFDNIIYTNENTKLIADRIEIDLITKNSKIFMNDDFKKVQIISKQ